ncbi:alpha-L-fucosidase [Nocardioides flavescens]|uniref:alpha-L-fucosidase n=1 Tax=Nocardioides flavescens TaxID=2691959 RepID=A0A6L7ENV3_9ACTN|nr:alpha-L-fucosidase [Nocardioides flavescens]MXG89027.1 alpha-L-fucosidase [Nocardioides flavescens]
MQARCDEAPAGGLSRRGLLTTAGAAGAAGALAGGLGGSVALADAVTDNHALLARFAGLRFGMVNHFGIGTFTGEDSAAPGRPPTTFAPTQVDCAQWAAAAKAAGMTYGVLTVKLPDGFALWPSVWSTQNVANSGWTQDVVAAYVEAFRAQGLRVGFSFSMWDRTQPVEAYDGRSVTDPRASVTPDDVDFVLGQLDELLSGYGEIDLLVTEKWADRAGQRAISVQAVREKVRALQPNCLMIDRGALSVPWLGDAVYFEEPMGIRAPSGNTFAAVQGQTIASSWLWRTSTPTESLVSASTTVSRLKELEGRYTSLLLNCPPNRNGRLDTNVVNRLAEIGRSWKPNTARAALPTQPVKVEWPVVPVAAWATAARDGEGPGNAIDGRSDNGWETCWSTWTSGNPKTGPFALPQSLVVDLGGTWSGISAVEYLPKQWGRQNGTDGDVTKAAISTSVDGVSWTKRADVSWAADRNAKLATWAPVTAAYVRLEVLAGSGNYANVGAVKVGGTSSAPVLLSRGALDGLTVRLVQAAGGLSAQVGGAGLVTGGGAAARQLWRLASTGDGYWTLEETASGQLLEVADDARAAGTAVRLGDDADSYRQHWALTTVAAGEAVLTNRFSGLVISTAGAVTGTGAGLVQGVPAAGQRAQRWSLQVQPVDGTAPAAASPSTPGVPSAAPVVAPTLNRVRVLAKRRRRTVEVTVAAAGATRVEARLSVTGAVVSRRTAAPGGAPSVVLRLPVPRTLGRARATVVVKVRGTGGIVVLKRRVVVPRPTGGAAS